MKKEDGIEQIAKAEWVVDGYGAKNLFVNTEDGLLVHAWLTLRPEYCDRGHIQLNIDGPLNLDSGDSFPRFFFNFQEADDHTRRFLLWRLWKYRTCPHTLMDVMEFAKAMGMKNAEK